MCELGQLPDFRMATWVVSVVIALDDRDTFTWIVAELYQPFVSNDDARRLLFEVEAEESDTALVEARRLVEHAARLARIPVPMMEITAERSAGT